jgi:hypothetical protein
MGAFYRRQKTEDRRQKPEARSKKQEARSKKNNPHPLQLVFLWILTSVSGPSGFWLLTIVSEPFWLLASAEPRVPSPERPTP